MFYNIQVTYLGKCDIPIIASCVRCAKKAMLVINVLISVYLTVLPSSRNLNSSMITMYTKHFIFQIIDSE